MNLLLPKVAKITSATIAISGSKSETNRLLILKELYPNLIIGNVSASDDSRLLQQALSSDASLIDIHHAGTAMRFLTAYYAATPQREVTLTGSPRMRQRPVGVLVDALRDLGADISYEENEGFPPLKIRGRNLHGGSISIQSDISSQFVTALMLVAPKMIDGLTLKLSGDVTSKPYIEMTLQMMQAIGIDCTHKRNVLTISHTPAVPPQKVRVESDWSSASYFYSIAALSEAGTSIRVENFYEKSFQGDSAVAEIYSEMGVDTVYENGQIIITKKNSPVNDLRLNLQDTPDLAQTIAVTCAGLGVGCFLTGLRTLKIKETDRILALKIELAKLGIVAETSNQSLSFQANTSLKSDCTIKTYDDHRMAMAFAPLALRMPLRIEQADVVSKSYPDFWRDLSALGITSLED